MRHPPTLQPTSPTPRAVSDAVQSQVAQVDVATGGIMQRFRDVGINSHGLVAWRDRFVMLSSQAAALVTLDPSSGGTDTVWSVRPSTSADTRPPCDQSVHR